MLPIVPHHVTQRGNGRQRTLFGDDDYAAYFHLLKKRCACAGVSVWASMLLRAGEDEAASMARRRAETIGRPLGDKRFQERVNAALGRDPAPKKRGRKVEISALSP